MISELNLAVAYDIFKLVTVFYFSGYLYILVLNQVSKKVKHVSNLPFFIYISFGIFINVIIISVLKIISQKFITVNLLLNLISILGFIFYLFLNKKLNYLVSTVARILMISIFIMIPVSYLADQEIGKYWHNGNPDIIDAACSNIILSSSEPVSPISTTSNFNSNEPFERRGIDHSFVFSDAAICGYTETYLYDSAVGQYVFYFTLAKLVHEERGLYVYLVMTNLLFVMYLMGLFLISREYFNFRVPIALLATVVIGTSHFYMATLVNGHIGTQMIALVIPWLLLLGNIKDVRKKILTVVVLIIFTVLSYPFILPFFVILYLILNHARDLFNYFKIIPLKTSKLNQLFLLAILFIAVYVIHIFLWDFTQQYRLRFENNFRSWYSIRTEYGILQYLGIFPSNLTEIGIQKYFYVFDSYFTEFFNTSVINLSTYILISFLVILSFSLVFILYNNSYFLNFVIGIAYLIILIPFFYFYIKDSYYLYKILYIFQMLILLVFFIFLDIVVTKKNTTKFLSVTLFTLILGSYVIINNYYNIKSMKELKSISYKYNYLYDVVNDIPKHVWRNSVLGIPERVETYVLSTILYENKFIDTSDPTGKPEYWIGKEGEYEGILEVARNKHIPSLSDYFYRSYEVDDFRFVYGDIWGVERYGDIQVRYVEYDPIMTFPSLNKDRRLEMCFSLHGSVNLKEQMKPYVRITTATEEVIARLEPEIKAKCEIIEVPRNVGVLSFKKNFQGSVENPFDSRRKAWILYSVAFKS